MTDKSPSDIAHEIAETLQGTPMSLGNALEQIGRGELENNIEFCTALDQLVFLCEGCGWWCEMSEVSTVDDGFCDECSPTDDD